LDKLKSFIESLSLRVNEDEDKKLMEALATKYNIPVQMQPKVAPKKTIKKGFLDSSSGSSGTPSGNASTQLNSSSSNSKSSQDTVTLPDGST